MSSHLLGIDIGTSAVKVTLLDANSGSILAQATSPQNSEIPLHAPHPGWAEQNPEDWWHHTTQALAQINAKTPLSNVQAIGIAYQMHGLVLVDQNQNPVRPAIIWCDSRAISQGDSIAAVTGPDYLKYNTLNPPGNFTASKLAWVAQNEPEAIKKTYKFMLPGDYIALKLTGQPSTTTSGLSEMILWDFEANAFAQKIFDQTGSTNDLIPQILPTFTNESPTLTPEAQALGLPKTAQVTYRAGDQPNNALSLAVLNPGEAATTAGTSGVVYAVTSKNSSDSQGRVNTFLHVNGHKGVLLCLNGCGSLYSWLRKTLCPNQDFNHLNSLASQSPIGSQGLLMYPFGNGAERILQNQDPGASIKNLRFPTHTSQDIARAAQEGIIFALNQGLDTMSQIGCPVTSVRAGKANLFLSDLFTQSFATITNCPVTLYNSDGSVGAALGAGIGAKSFTAQEGCQAILKPITTIDPNPADKPAYDQAFNHWIQNL